MHGFTNRGSFLARFAETAGHLVVLLLIIGFITPFQIYAANDAEFGTAFWNMLQHAIVPLVLGTFGLAVLISCLPYRLFIAIIAIVVALVVLTYAQSSLLVWDYGILSGEPIAWENFKLAGYVDSLIWVGVLLVALIRPVAMQQFGRRSSPFIVVIALSVQLLQAFSKDVPLWQEPRPSPIEHVYEFSPEKNVLVFVLDSFLAPAFDAALEQSPDLRSHFAGFTYYQNMLSAFSTTAPSIPALLTGKQYDNSLPLRKFWQSVLQEESLPMRAIAQGYQAALVTLPQLCARTKLPCYSLNKVLSKDTSHMELRDLMELLDVALFRVSPQPVKVQLYANERWFLQRYFIRSGTPRALFDSFHVGEGFARAIGNTATQPTFKFIHLLLPHPPFRFSPSCGPVTRVGASERELYEDQAICTLHIIGEIFEEMKKHSVFDSSMILVVADHGHSLHYMPFKRPSGFPILEQAMPLLLVKAPHASLTSPLSISQAPVSTVDVARSIAETMGIEGSFPGENIFKLSERDERTRTYRSYGWQDAFWKRDYLPKMEEFIVKANVRDPNAWNRGTTFSPPSATNN
ncbi:MAG: sulfatase-like hydrolase/transferase [Oligoflexia bacterium]|nr:sulfatase-like hydrolase/transferase [Oligoflexia bacterium]